MVIKERMFAGAALAAQFVAIDRRLLSHEKDIVELKDKTLLYTEKCPVPRKRELSLEEGNGETATRMLAILASGERSRSELASELGISSQPWLSRAYLNPLMARGYIAQTLPKKPRSPLQRYRLLRKGKDVLV